MSYSLSMLMLVNLMRMTQGKAWSKNRQVNRRISSMDQEMNDRIFNFDSRQRNVDWNGKRVRLRQTRKSETSSNFIGFPMAKSKVSGLSVTLHLKLRGVFSNIF